MHTWPCFDEPILLTIVSRWAAVTSCAPVGSSATGSALVPGGCRRCCWCEVGDETARSILTTCGLRTGRKAELRQGWKSYSGLNGLP
uniref:Putative secreted protein n=1 Tax=Anopheles darlingi TaxID=43151 RepID=A0A2M4DQ18_ANODA